LGYGTIVDILIRAGGNLGGSDVEGGFADLAVRRAALSTDLRGTAIWKTVGIQIEYVSAEESKHHD
jgi:lysophospholipase